MNRIFLFLVLITGALSVVATILAFLSASQGIVAARKRTLKNWSLLFVLLILILPCLALPWLLKRASAPVIHQSLENRRTESGVILQSSPYSCAPASLANVANHYGFSVSESEMAEFCRTTAHGSYPQNMMRAMESLGFSCQMKRIKLERLDSLTKPLVLIVDHPATGRESHTIVYLGRSQQARELFQIIDPLRGESLLSEWELTAIFHGLVMVCEPSDRNPEKPL